MSAALSVLAKNERPLAQRIGEDFKIPSHVGDGLGLDAGGVRFVRRIPRRVIHAQIRRIKRGGEVEHPAQIGRPRGRRHGWRQARRRIEVRQIDHHGGTFCHDAVIRQAECRHLAPWIDLPVALRDVPSGPRENVNDLEGSAAFRK